MVPCGTFCILNEYKETKWQARIGLHLAPGRESWRAVKNTVMNFETSFNLGYFLTS